MILYGPGAGTAERGPKRLRFVRALHLTSPRWDGQRQFVTNPGAPWLVEGKTPLEKYKRGGTAQERWRRRQGELLPLEGRPNFHSLQGRRVSPTSHLPSLFQGCALASQRPLSRERARGAVIRSRHEPRHARTPRATKEACVYTGRTWVTTSLDVNSTDTIKTRRESTHNTHEPFLRVS